MNERVRRNIKFFLKNLGILAMPQAFYYAGYASGILNTVFITFISTYCLLMLVSNCLQINEVAE